VSPLAIRHLPHRFSARRSVLFAVIVLSGAIAMHHSFVSAGDMHHDAGITAAVELCLGVLAAGAAAVSLAIGVLALVRYRPPRVLSGDGSAVAVSVPVVRNRAGPALLCLLCVRKR
jgi:hypothetical protein